MNCDILELIERRMLICTFDRGLLDKCKQEIERLRAAYNNDVEERQQWQEKCETLEVEIEQLRALLREAVQDPERVEVNGVRQWELMVSDEWFTAAKAAGGGDDIHN